MKSSIRLSSLALTVTAATALVVGPIADAGFAAQARGTHTPIVRPAPEPPMPSSSRPTTSTATTSPRTPNTRTARSP